MITYPSNNAVDEDYPNTDIARLKADVQAALDDPSPSIPHEEVMQRMWAKIEVLKALNNSHESAVHA